MNEMKFKVGQRVYDKEYGFGEVTRIDRPHPYRVQAEFFDFPLLPESYTSDGRKRVTDHHTSLLPVYRISEAEKEFNIKID